MPTAEELLNQAVEEGAVGSDTKAYLTVDLESRQIIIPSTVKNLGVESDDEVKRLYFKIPRYYGEVDLYETFHVRVNYTNAENEEDIYYPEDVALDGNYIVFSWLIGRFAVTKEGNVKFNICMIKYQEDGITIDQEFNATPTSLPVLKGLECSGAVYEKERDALAGVAREAVENERQYIDERVDRLVTDMVEETLRVNDFAGAYETTKRGRANGSLYIDDADNTEHKVIIKVRDINEDKKINIIPYNLFGDGCIGDVSASADEYGRITIQGTPDYGVEDGTMISIFTPIHSIELDAGTYTVISPSSNDGLTGIAVASDMDYDGDLGYSDGDILTFTLDTRKTVYIQILSMFNQGHFVDLRLSPISLYVGEIHDIANPIGTFAVVVFNLENDDFVDVSIPSTGVATIQKPYAKFGVEIRGPEASYYDIEVTYNRSIASLFNEFERAIDASIALCDTYIGGDSE